MKNETRIVTAISLTGQDRAKLDRLAGSVADGNRSQVVRRLIRLARIDDVAPAIALDREGSDECNDRR